MARLSAWLLAASAICLAAAPLLLGDGYDWLANTTSESAAQDLSGAWLARTGFVLFGVGVVAIASVRHDSWGSLATTFHVLFGLSMVVAAVFSNRPITSDVPVDTLEDSIHSIAATTVGFAFAGGVAAVGYRRWWTGGRSVFDLVAVSASVVIPLAMVGLADVAGLLQRTMFLLAYGWYLIEALKPVELPATSWAHMR